MLLPEIKLRSQMFDIVFEVVKDIHTSPQNDITKFPDYSCSNYAILWNLRHSSKFSVSEDMYINIAMEIDSLNKQAAVLMAKKFSRTYSGGLRRGPGPKAKKKKAVMRKPKAKVHIEKNVGDDDLLSDHENQKVAFINKNLSFARKKRKPPFT